MGIGFWVKRFFTVLGGAFLTVCAAQLLRGHKLPDAALQGTVWGFQARQGW